jgi:serine/threonine protein kinase
VTQHAIDAARALAPGESFEGYQIVELVARGGRSLVYKALCVATDELVALKILCARVSVEQVALLRQTLSALRSIAHPNLERTLAGGLVDGRPWFVTQLLRGHSLEVELASQGPLSTENAIEMGIRIARGLAAIHERGHVYRNLKPSNVQRVDGEVKLLDVAFSLMTPDDHPLSTPQVSSPEELAGAALDPRADIYSLGALLFQAVTGRPPFEGTLQDVRNGHLHQSAPLVSALNHSTKPLQAVVGRALAKSPDDRFATMNAMILALEQAAGALLPASAEDSLAQDPAPNPPRRTRTWLFWLALVAILAILLGFGIWLGCRDRDRDPGLICVILSHLWALEPHHRSGLGLRV